MNAKKETLGEREALKLTKAVDHIYAAKGKKVVHLNLKKEKPDTETLKKVLLGPTGNLRAPTLRVGKKLLVGFDPSMYDSIFN